MISCTSRLLYDATCNSALQIIIAFLHRSLSKAKNTLRRSARITTKISHDLEDYPQKTLLLPLSYDYPLSADAFKDELKSRRNADIIS